MKKILTVFIFFTYYGSIVLAQTPVVSFTLTGSINPNGVACTVYFEYGKTYAYGNILAVTPS